MAQVAWSLVPRLAPPDSVSDANVQAPQATTRRWITPHPLLDTGVMVFAPPEASTLGRLSAPDVR